MSAPVSEEPRSQRAKKIAASHVHVAGDGHIRMTHSRIDLDFETLIGFDERVGDTHGVDHADVVVHVAGGEHEMAFQIFCDVGVFVDFVVEFDVAVLRVSSRDAVVLFAPVAIVDVVIVIAGFGPASVEEIRKCMQCRGRHKAAARMAPHADTSEIDVRMKLGEVLVASFFVSQSIIAEIAVAVVVVPFVALRIAAAVADFDHDEPHLGECDRWGSAG